MIGINMTDEMQEFLYSMRRHIRYSNSSGPFGGDGTILITTDTLSSMLDYIEAVENIQDKLREKQNEQNSRTD